MHTFYGRIKKKKKTIYQYVTYWTERFTWKQTNTFGRLTHYLSKTRQSHHHHHSYSTNYRSWLAFLLRLVIFFFFLIGQKQKIKARIPMQAKNWERKQKLHQKALLSLPIHHWRSSFFELHLTFFRSYKVLQTDPLFRCL